MRGSDRSTYVVNQPRVVHECVDGEVIAIDLRTGAYSSMRDTAAVVWETLVAGHDVAAVVRRLHDAYAVEPGVDVAAEVSSFVATLVGQELLVPGGAAPSALPSLPAGRRYVTPTVEVFTDMADAILLDPVHDVDADAGWPHLPQEAAIARIDGAGQA